MMDEGTLNKDVNHPVTYSMPRLKTLSIVAEIIKGVDGSILFYLNV